MRSALVVLLFLTFAAPAPTPQPVYHAPSSGGGSSGGGGGAWGGEFGP